MKTLCSFIELWPRKNPTKLWVMCLAKNSLHECSEQMPERVKRKVQRHQHSALMMLLECSYTHKSMNLAV